MRNALYNQENLTEKSIDLGGVLPASAIALGCMRMPDDADNIVMTAIENGINFFDHADIYRDGASEEAFGKVLKLHPVLRDKIVLQSKCGICEGYYDASREHMGVLTKRFPVCYHNGTG